jgi:endonuclease/exonuclease/phosphatase family metal-dependent hydrolase
MKASVLAAGIGLLLSGAAGAACERSAPAPRVAPAPGAEQLSLATLNLWRLRDSERDARYDKPLPKEQVRARLAALAEHVIERLGRPHLLAVQEVENRALLERLARRLAARGVEYEVVLREGHDPSGIDVGLLYRAPVRVAGQGSLFDQHRRDGRYLFSRPPLRVRLDRPLPLELIVVHLRSAHGLDEPGVRDRRRAQARALREWARSRSRPGRGLLIAGDFNSGPVEGVFGVPWRILSRGFSSVWDHLPADERFSFIHECRRQAIDHILYDAHFADKVIDAAVSRGNAGHYRALYGRNGTGSVVSDHDSPVLYWRRGDRQ